MLAVAAVLAATVSCGRRGGPSARQLSEADSLYDAGDITLINAAKSRGNAYYNLGNYRLAEKEFRLALAETPASTVDSADYYHSATALTYTLIMKGNYEEA